MITDLHGYRFAATRNVISGLPRRIPSVAIDFPEPLLSAERTAWAAIQAGTLTADQAAAVHAGVTAFAEEAGLERLDVEEQLKRAVRHPELAV